MIERFLIIAGVLALIHGAFFNYIIFIYFGSAVLGLGVFLLIEDYLSFVLEEKESDVMNHLTGEN